MDKPTNHDCECARETISRWLCDHATPDEVSNVQRHLRKCADCKAVFIATGTFMLFQSQDEGRLSANKAASMSVDDVGIAKIA